MPTVRTLSIGLLLAALPTAFAQQFLPTSATSTFPACAVNCAVLVQAEQICASSTPPGSSQVSFENCFCQSPSLAALYTTPDAVCTGECTAESDRTELRAWFTSFCQAVAQGVDPNTVASQSQIAATNTATSLSTAIPTATTATTATPSVTVVTITPTSSSAPAATGTGSGAGSSVAPARQQSWIDSHWRWILMLGILIIGLILLACLGVYLKRRHRRKKEEQRASASGFPTEDEKRRDGARAATPDLWGPHQHMHATKGWQYPTEAATAIPSSRPESRGHSSRRSQRDRPLDSRTSTMRTSTILESDVQRPSSRLQSMKGKGKERVKVSQSRSGSSNRHGSRSRSHRQRDRDRDKDIEKGLGGA